MVSSGWSSPLSSTSLAPCNTSPVSVGAEIVTSSSQDSGAPVVAVPEEAIQTVEGAPALFVPVAGEPDTFQKRAVTIGAAVGGLVPVYSGLLEGESFVSAGSFLLKAELGKGAAAHEH